MFICSVYETESKIFRRVECIFYDYFRYYYLIILLILLIITNYTY